MGGKFSRDKGRRGEQQLVLYLYKLGYKAERILRQYQEAGQADVKATKGEQTYTFELKTRREGFKSLYDMYYRERDPDEVLRFTHGPSGTAVAMSTDFESLHTPDMHFRAVSEEKNGKKDMKIYTRIVSLKILKQTADYLVLKDNNKPRLFLKYWG